MKRRLILLCLAVFLCAGSASWILFLRLKAGQASRFRRFPNAGFEMEIPGDAPFVSGTSTGALVMLRRVSRGAFTEPDYIIQIEVRRASKREVESFRTIAAQSSDDLTMWQDTGHANTDVFKGAYAWYVRRDLNLNREELVVVTAKIQLTDRVQADLAETVRIVNSLRALPKDSTSETK